MKFFSDIERDRKDNTLWCEKHRPKNLDTFIGSKSIKETFQNYIDTNDIPHLLFYGKAGTGKTSLAKILVQNIECDYLYINASDENSVDVVRSKIKSFASSIGFKDLKVVILDESDALTPQSQAALRNLMETFSQHTRFILTCNFHEKIIDPIVSRCQVYELAPLSRKEVAVHLSKILTNEGVSFDPKDIALIINQSYPDIRKCINNCQMNTKSATLRIDEDKVIASDYKLKILQQLKDYSSKNKKKTFTAIRKTIANNKVRDFSELYRFLFDNIDEYAKGKEAETIVILADSQYRDGMVVDHEITFMSCIVQLLNTL